MGWFGKKDKIVDLSGRYKTDVKKQAKSSDSDGDNSNLGFLGNLASGSDSNASSGSDVSWDNDSPAQNENRGEKKQKLVKRFLEMTDRIEDLSNQVYHLKQRVELLEKKLKISFK